MTEFWQSWITWQQGTRGRVGHAKEKKTTDIRHSLVDVPVQPCGPASV